MGHDGRVRSPRPKAATGGGAAGPPGVRRLARESVLAKAAPETATAAALGQGAPLQPDVRREFEHKLGHDFGAVRVHTGNEAERATASLNASGFTLGRNVVFGGGVSDQASTVGRRILAHELRHVVQQARFLDHQLGGAPVQDASHPAEHEARAEMGSLTPLATPAVQRAPLILPSGQQLLVDLSESTWRDSLQFARNEAGEIVQTEIVYVLRDKSTGELLKIGSTDVEEIATTRFPEYVNAGNKWKRELVADVWTFPEQKETAETFEAEMRATLEKAGEELPWDNTRIVGRGRRLGRAGQGIPFPGEKTEMQFIDEAEQLRVTASQGTVIPPRRGMGSAEKAKLKAESELPAAERKAAEDARAAKPRGRLSKAEKKTAEELKKRVKKPPKPRPKPKSAFESEAKAPERAEAPPIEEKPPAPTGQVGEAGGDVTEQTAKKVATGAAGATETVAAEATDEAAALAAKRSAQVAAEAAAGTLTAGVAGTVLEVLSNPALGFGYMVLEGISGDYHAAWDAIKAPARVRGFAQGMAARFAGLDGHAALMMITPDFAHQTIGATIVGAEGMEEQALLDGAREGWKYADGYSTERRKRELDRAAARLKARGGPDLEYDVDGQIMRQSLRNVGEMFLPKARDAIARWDALREKRERKKKADQLREMAKYDPISGYQLRAVANSLDPEGK